MYQLYYSPGAASLVLHWLLIDMGLPHALRKVDMAAKEHKSPEYLKLNPSGVVPTLIIDGTPMVETAALVMTLADRHPELGYAPAVGSEARAWYHQWIVHLANALQPPFRDWFYADQLYGGGHEAMVQAESRTRIEACFDRLDQHLAARGPFVCGSEPTAADFYATMLMRWSRNMPRPATTWPHLAELARRMKARPSFQVLYEREGLTEWP